MASPLPAKKRRFRLGRILLAILAVFVLLVGAGLIFRTDLATWGARAYLESEGVEVGGLEVTALWTDDIEVRDISLGAGRELTIDRLHVDPMIFTIGGPVRVVGIEGMELHLDVTGDKPLLGSLQPLVDRLTAEENAGPSETGEPAAGGGDSAARADVPLSVDFSNSKVVIETPSGPMTADLIGSFTEEPTGSQSVRASLDLDSELGRLTADIVARRGTDGTLDLTAEIAEGRFAWEGFALGAVSGNLEVSQAAGEAPRIDADLDLSDLAYAPTDKAPLQLSGGHLSAKGSLANADISLVLDGAEEHLELAFKAQQAAAEDGQQVSLGLDAEIRTAGGLAQFLPLPGPQITAGTLVVQADGEGTLAGDPTAAGTWIDPAALLATSRLQLAGDVLLGGVALSDGTSGISAHLPLVTEMADNSLTFTLAQDAAVRIERPTRDRLTALGVPADLLPLLVSGLNLTLAAEGQTPFRLAASPAWPPHDLQVAVAARAASDQGLKLSARSEGSATLSEALELTAYNGSLTAGAEAERLAIGGREARGVAVSLPLAVDYGGNGLDLELQNTGSLGIRQFGDGAPLRLQNPLSLEVEELALATTPDGAGYRYSLKAREDGIALAITTAEADPLPVTAEAIRAALSGSFAPDAGHDADLQLSFTGFALPGYDFATEVAEVIVALDRDLRPATSRFTLGPFQVGGADPLTAPLSLTGNLQRKGNGYDIAGELGLSEGRALADLTGRVNDDGSASAKAVSRLISFAPDGLQPGDLSPLLADLQEVRGGLTATANFAWPRDPDAESARLTLSDFSFTGQGVDVSGLDLDLALPGLQPLASAPGQKLTVAALEAGVPVENIALTFSLDPAPTPHVRVAEGGFDLAGARWQIEPTALDPAADSNRVVLATEALDLATFFELIEIDGLSGRGTLRGRLPVVLAGEDVIVDDGHFEAQGPGQLSIRIPALRAALTSGGATVEMAAKALEDFQFEELTLDLAKTAANDATVKLSTLGGNPEVLDGQPFRFNINLESNLTSVLNALQQGLSLSDEAVRRAWQLRE